MIDIEGIDYNEVKNRLMCDDETVCDIIKAFRMDVGEKYKNIRLEKNDENFVTLAHGIKGACANIGAQKCMELAKTLELKARSEGRIECNYELAMLSIKLCDLFDSIDAYFKTTDK